MAASPKTTPTAADVEAFLARVPSDTRRDDARALCALLGDVTGEPPVLWGTSIVGFGSYHYRYDSGREGDWPLAGFSPRKAHLVVYLTGGFADRHHRLLAKLGPHKAGKGCLYIKRLADVDLGVLRDLVERSLRVLRGVERAQAKSR
jgi:Domain of unknown function (DU1801)